ncbi:MULTISPECIES: hypothetical protein [unclassified Mycolicibacterium]|uniref:hypothetical protein n=1 Tax=unclassified Mycolicibacterium TaxID=2636767 RepID=UPI001F4C4A2D|nr:hypothetical protein [Mycolicibacterium sp. YH-1]UNB54077.1 hypothetical protein L0M16_06995 [Mycolicibacterium sp. YH-1]
MVTQNNSVVRRLATTVSVAGGAAAIAAGMALAGAGTAAADNQQNVTRDGNKFSPGDRVSSQSVRSSASATSDPGTNFLTQVGTAIQNGQIQLGTAGTNAISQTGTAVQNAQTQVGTAGTNALTQVGQAGNGLLNGIGNLFNRG